MLCASLGMEQATLPPMSVTWPNIAAQPTMRSVPGTKMGITTSQSLAWDMAPSQL